MVRLTTIATFLVFITLPCTALASDSYDATVDQLFHGFLLVTDVQCHHHDLTFSNGAGGVSRKAFDAWGSQHFNVHVVSHYDGDLEYADEIYPRGGGNAITKCAAEQQSFGTHIDGRIASWSEGNAVGDFVLTTSTGATKTFTFLAGHEPSVNGHHVFCENGPDPDIGCERLKAPVTFGRTRVRVYYKIVDSPDGPSDEVTKIETL